MTFPIPGFATLATPERPKPTSQKCRAVKLSGIVACVLCAACSGETAQRRAEPAPKASVRSQANPKDPVRGHAGSLRTADQTTAGHVGAASIPEIAAWDPLALPRFFSKLAALENKTANEHARIFWLGDSHTAADFWTGTVREALSARFGAGGPGYVRVGMRDYRHARVKVEREGRFRPEPIPFACRTPQADGIFGLGGVRVTPIVTARVLLDVAPDAMRGNAEWQVLFNLPKRSSFRVDVGPTHQLIVEEPERLPGSAIARQSFEAGPRDRFVLTALSGMPRFYGVIVEGTEPGVVLDTSGINGARAETALAWAEEPFVAEIAARAPDLIVIAYGTNEAFDALRVTAYREHYHNLMTRLRKGAPHADCLVVGPPDAMGIGTDSEPRVEQISQIERDAARELGCGFISAAELMGGQGSFLRWLHHRPQLARSDRIHLTIAGYVKLGELMSEQLLSAYDKFKAEQ